MMLRIVIGYLRGSDDRKKVMNTQLLMVLLHKAKMIAPVRQSTYKKGPDVMTKSVRTQERYRKTWKNQTNLAQFGFGNPGSSELPMETSMAVVASDVRDPGSDDSEAVLLGVASQFSHHSSSGRQYSLCCFSTACPAHCK